LLSVFLESVALYDVLNLLNAGISVETIARSVTFGAFIQGIVNPDLAELLIAPLSLMLTLEASKAGITPTVLSNISIDTIPEENILDIMKDLRPEKYYELQEKAERGSSKDAVEKEVLPKTEQSFMNLVNKEDK